MGNGSIKEYNKKATIRCAGAWQRFRRNLKIGKFLRGKDRVLILLKGSEELYSKQCNRVIDRAQ